MFSKQQQIMIDKKTLESGTIHILGAIKRKIRMGWTDFGKQKRYHEQKLTTFVKEKGLQTVHPFRTNKRLGDLSTFQGT